MEETFWFADLPARKISVLLLVSWDKASGNYYPKKLTSSVGANYTVCCFRSSTIKIFPLVSFLRFCQGSKNSWNLYPDILTFLGGPGIPGDYHDTAFLLPWSKLFGSLICQPAKSASSYWSVRRDKASWNYYPKRQFFSVGANYTVCSLHSSIIKILLLISLLRFCQDS